MNMQLLLIMLLLSVPIGIGFYWLIGSLEKKTQHHWHQKNKEWHQQIHLLHLDLNAQTLLTLYIAVALGLVSYAAFVISDYTLTIGAILLLAVLPRLIFRFLKYKRRQLFEQLLPEALTQIAGSLRSGASLINAIDLYVEDTKGPLAQELHLFIKEYRFGVPMLEALELLAKRVNNSNLNLVVSTTRISTELGGNLAETYERLGSTLQQKLMIEKKIEAFTSQGKLQGWVVGALPFGLMAVLDMIEPEAMGSIFSTWLGWGVLGLIFLLEFLGITMIRKIVNIDV